WDYIPDTGDVPVACDMSSNILSKPVDVSRYGLIYAGVQKNMAPAGMAVVILDKKLIGMELPYTPTLMSYKAMYDGGSMPNTPACYTIYMLGLVLKWVEEQGGLEAMKQLREKRSGLLYSCLDSSSFYRTAVERGSRSGMNVTFRTPSEELDKAFVAGAAEKGLVNLKGHRKTGGIRASIYNAMPVEGVEALCKYMYEFEKEHR
ncbi:MAG: 3-phosphoserine/phosphohydroxythreonine transaminase, partial [Oscillospiraceae bacterium]|nr:3-phosphoserine/phosphohydroxythreonine transaminase [Oscillospiraceae bacterium]